MKFNYGIFLGMFLLIIFTVGIASANDNLTVENAMEDVNNDLSVSEVNDVLGADNQSDVSLKSNSNAKVKKATPIKTKVKFSNGISKYKKSKYYKIKITDKKTKKPIKYLKFKLKLKLFNKNYKTYTLKTNGRGIAKFNMKKLKPGSYAVHLLSSDKYLLDDGKDKTIDDFIAVWKTKKSVTLKMGTSKKIKGTWMSTFYETKKNKQYPRGVYVEGDIGNDHPDYVILKAKFFFKNKNGKIITKTTTGPGVKLIKGYTPIKTKVWYGTLR